MLELPRKMIYQKYCNKVIKLNARSVLVVVRSCVEAVVQSVQNA